MTVALGLVCSDGVIVAADSQGTAANVAIQSQKVNALSDAPIVWTASGSVFVIEEVGAALDALQTDALKSEANASRRALLQLEEKDFRLKVGGAIAAATKKSYEAALPHGIQFCDATTGQHVFNSDFLVLGFREGRSLFLEHAGNGEMNWHHAAGFCATGSGGEFATVASALLSHYLVGGRLPLDDGLLIAYRTIDTICRVSSGLVGGPVQLAVADASGARVLSPVEVDEVHTSVDGWMELERNTLTARKGSPPVPEPLPAMGIGRPAAEDSTG